MEPKHVDELLAADQVVITTPTYNLSLPAALKAWIDQVVRVGRTFARHDGGFKGLASVKRAIVIVASGSDFRSAHRASPITSSSLIFGQFWDLLGSSRWNLCTRTVWPILAAPKRPALVAETTLDEFARTVAA